MFYHYFSSGPEKAKQNIEVEQEEKQRTEQHAENMQILLRTLLVREGVSEGFYTKKMAIWTFAGLGRTAS